METMLLGQAGRNRRRYVSIDEVAIGKPRKRHALSGSTEPIIRLSVLPSENKQWMSVSAVASSPLIE